MAKFYAIDANGNSALLSIPMQGFTQSLQQNGWCKLPNGLILQWGHVNDPNRLRIYYFSIAFNSACYNVSVTTHGNNGHYTSSITETNWEGDIRHGDDNKVGWWIALGY